MNHHTTVRTTACLILPFAVFCAGCNGPVTTAGRPAGWTSIWVTRVVAVEPLLLFHAPPDLKEVPVQGKDSFVKLYRSPTIELHLGYGWYSDPLKYQDKPGYVRRNVTVSGRKAYIVTFEDVVALHVPQTRLLGRESLTMYARCSDAQARQQVEQLFQSIQLR